jgi:hypothetical protein
MEPFHSKWKSWGKKSANEGGDSTAITDKTRIFAKKSLNEGGDSTAITDKTSSVSVQPVVLPQPSLSPLEAAPHYTVPCLHQWKQTGRQATCTVCAFTVPVLPRDGRG